MSGHEGDDGSGAPAVAGSQPDADARDAMGAAPGLDEIVVADPPDTWQGMGFTVDDGVVCVGGVRIRLVGGDGGITGWSLRGLPPDLDVGAAFDGLPTSASRAAPPGPASHPIGAVAVDHVVALTPDFDRTVERLRAAGLDHRRTRDAGNGWHQAFFVVGPCLLELGGPAPNGDIRFWGLTLVVEDLDAAAELLGDRLGRIKDAVQPGRRIATVRPSAGSSVPLALMTPRR